MRPVDILFVHNNFPAQFRNLAQRLARIPGIRIKAIAAPASPGLPEVDMHRYPLRPSSPGNVHPFAQRFELDCRRAELVLYEAAQLVHEEFYPQLIYVHPGWGEALPLRSVFPDASICTFSEFYYAARGTDVGFDREFDQFGVDGEVRIALRNASTLLSLSEADFSIAPTRWQNSVFPKNYRSKIHVVHDGLDIDLLPLGTGDRRLSLPGLEVGPNDEVVTFVSRNLEPYRGFHVFMRAIPQILRERPRARILLVGGDSVSYGAAPRYHASWRNFMLEELGDRIDFSRVHFLGTVDYQAYLSILRRSDAHVYLTYPFVLSWSMLEAMALECLIVGSDTQPVAEVVSHGQNGLLVPFFNIDRLVETVVGALANPERYRDIRKEARQTIIDNYQFKTSSWPKHVELIHEYCYSGRLLRLVDADVARFG